METIYLSIQSSLTVTIIVGLFFIGLGYLNSNQLNKLICLNFYEILLTNERNISNQPFQRSFRVKAFGIRSKSETN